MMGLQQGIYIIASLVLRGELLRRIAHFLEAVDGLLRPLLVRPVHHDHPRAAVLVVDDVFVQFDLGWTDSHVLESTLNILSVIAGADIVDFHKA